MSKRTSEWENQYTNQNLNRPDVSYPAMMMIGVLLFIIGVILLTVLPYYFFNTRLPQLTEPLRNNGPVVIVTYGLFALPSLVFGGILLIVMPLGNFVKLTWPKFEARVEHIGRPFMWLGVIAFFWMAIAVPILGKSTEFYVAAQGYEKCDPLTYFAFAAYRPGYVKDPRLCVDHDRIDEALERYGYEPLPGTQNRRLLDTCSPVGRDGPDDQSRAGAVGKKLALSDPDSAEALFLNSTLSTNTKRNETIDAINRISLPSRLPNF